MRLALKITPKRANFIGIQNGHGIACDGYKQSAVRTGYEQVLAHRTSDLYAYTAKQDGQVISKTDTGVIIQYKDGTQKGIEIGRRFGAAAGLIIPHDVVSDMKPGEIFKKGKVICYNTGFFEKDMLNPDNVVWKIGITVKTALYESSQTLEDSSSISKRLSAKLSTNTTKVKTVVLTFDQEIRNVVKVGDAVEPDTILCLIEDAITSGSGLFDEESLNTLKLLSGQSPTAKVRGVIDKIEVFYNGDKEDMTPSLLLAANTSDRELTKRCKSSGKFGFTGSVTEEFRVDSEPLAMDTMVIKFYITSNIGTGIGDKGVFCNQLKTIFGEVLGQEMITEDGDIVDAVFGQQSISNRIVNSPYVIGTTNTLLKVIGKKAVSIYKGSK